MNHHDTPTEHPVTNDSPTDVAIAAADEPFRARRGMRRRSVVGTAAAATTIVAAFLAAVAIRSGDGDITDQGGGWIGPVNGEPGVIYEFHDASVAPEHHRGFTLTVWEGSARLVVDRYHGGADDVTRRIDTETWKRTLAAALDLAGDAGIEQVDCPATTADELTVVDGGGTEIVHVYVDHCNDVVTPDLRNVVGEVLAEFDLHAMQTTVNDDLGTID